VEDQEELSFRFDHDALAEAAEAHNGPAFDGRKRRIDRAQRKRTGQPDAGDPLACNSRLERVKVQEDVGQLGHGVKKPGLIFADPSQN
jgi:hypothetical protein